MSWHLYFSKLPWIKMLFYCCLRLCLEWSSSKILKSFLLFFYVLCFIVFIFFWVTNTCFCLRSLCKGSNFLASKLKIFKLAALTHYLFKLNFILKPLIPRVIRVWWNLGSIIANVYNSCGTAWPELYKFFTSIPAARLSYFVNKV